jgi:hypothetical protein
VNVLALLVAMTLPLAQPLETRTIQWASPMQGEAFAYGPFPQCASGGWGSGKTHAYVLKAIYLSSEYPHNRGVIARHVGRDLRDTTAATFFKVCPPRLYDRRAGGRRNDQNGYVKFADTGSEILFLHLDDPETLGIIRGLEINWFYIDQCEENPDHMEEIFDLLCGRLGRWDVAEVPARQIAAYRAETGEAWPYVHPESGKPVPPSYPMITCNPDVETHWIYRRFHPESPEHHQTYAKLGYKMFHMPSTDNRFLGETNLRFLQAHDTAFIRRNVQGLWGQPEGAIHVVHPSSVLAGTPELLAFFRQHCNLFRTLDYGDSAPTCCLWWAVDRNGNCFIWQEYYLPNARISTHRANIAGLSAFDHYDLNLADPSIFHQMPAKHGGRFCIADEYADCKDQPRETALFWQAADNNELGTRNRINEYLAFDATRLHPITHEPGSARLFFVTRNDNYPNGVVHALRETRNQRRVKIGTDLGKPIFSDERDPSVVDHGYDTVRYGIASRPPAPPAEVQVIDGTFQGARRLAKLHRQRMSVR